MFKVAPFLVIAVAAPIFFKKIRIGGVDSAEALLVQAVEKFELERDAEVGSGRDGKIERSPDQFGIPMDETGLEEFFSEGALNDEVSLFVSPGRFEGFRGRVSMLHSKEDGSRVARLKEQSVQPNGGMRSRTLFVAAMQDGYEGFLQEEGARHVFKFSNFDEQSELEFEKLPLDKFLCVSISGGEIKYGLPSPSQDEQDHGPCDHPECLEPVLGAALVESSHATAPSGSTTQSSSSDYTVPKLSSKRKADKVLYLDFNGQKISGTVWNEDQSTIRVRSIMADQVDSKFVRDVWLKVAAAYSTFNVNVTTDVTKYRNAKASKRWMMLGSSKPGQLGLSDLGGISYIGVFGKSYYSPSFFFVKSGHSADTVARLIIHEAGHAMGLSHDGRRNSPSMEYYKRHGKSPRTWATWMGHSYGADITQWSRGEYYLASNKEDDLTILSSALGAAGGGSSSLRKPVTIGLPGTKVGSIVSNSDSDYFVIKGGKGKKVKITVSPRMGSRSLFPNLVLLDVKGNQISSKKVRNRRGLSMNTRLVLPKDEVIVRISGVGFGRPSRPSSNGFPTGATRYGSVGPYSVRVQLE